MDPTLSKRKIMDRLCVRNEPVQPNPSGSTQTGKKDLHQTPKTTESCPNSKGLITLLWGLNQAHSIDRKGFYGLL